MIGGIRFKDELLNHTEWGFYGVYSLEFSRPRVFGSRVLRVPVFGCFRVFRVFQIEGLRVEGSVKIVCLVFRVQDWLPRYKVFLNSGVLAT